MEVSWVLLYITFLWHTSAAGLLFRCSKAANMSRPFPLLAFQGPTKPSLWLPVQTPSPLPVPEVATGESRLTLVERMHSWSSTSCWILPSSSSRRRCNQLQQWEFSDPVCSSTRQQPSYFYIFTGDNTLSSVCPPVCFLSLFSFVVLLLHGTMLMYILLVFVQAFIHCPQIGTKRSIHYQHCIRIDRAKCKPKQITNLRMASSNFKTSTQILTSTALYIRRHRNMGLVQRD